jgi:hypothetical protein
MVVKC